jgi:hypothetical protein
VPREAGACRGRFLAEELIEKRHYVGRGLHIDRTCLSDGGRFAGPGRFDAIELGAAQDEVEVVFTSARSAGVQRSITRTLPVLSARALSTRGITVSPKLTST